MGYVDRQLGTGERVMARTRLHPVMFSGASSVVLFVVVVVTLLIVRNQELSRGDAWLLVIVGAGIALLSLLPPFLRWRTAEFAVTDRRLLARVGLRSLQTLELPLPSVEAISVSATMLGRLLGYGTLLVSGGGTVESFVHVAHPETLKDAVVRQTGRRLS